MDGDRKQLGESDFPFRRHGVGDLYAGRLGSCRGIRQRTTGCIIDSTACLRWWTPFSLTPFPGSSIRAFSSALSPPENNQVSVMPHVLPFSAGITFHFLFFLFPMLIEDDAISCTVFLPTRYRLTRSRPESCCSLKLRSDKKYSGCEYFLEMQRYVRLQRVNCVRRHRGGVLCICTRLWSINRVQSAVSSEREFRWIEKIARWSGVRGFQVETRISLQIAPTARLPSY